MRAFAAAWSEPDIVQAPLAQLSWYRQVTLIEKLDTKARRAGALYIANVFEEGGLVHDLKMMERFGDCGLLPQAGGAA